MDIWGGSLESIDEGTASTCDVQESLAFRRTGGSASAKERWDHGNDFADKCKDYPRRIGGKRRWRLKMGNKNRLRVIDSGRVWLESALGRPIEDVQVATMGYSP